MKLILQRNTVVVCFSHECDSRQSKGDSCGPGGECDSAGLCRGKVCEVDGLCTELVLFGCQFGCKSSLRMHLVGSVGEDEILGVVSSVEFSV